MITRKNILNHDNPEIELRSQKGSIRTISLPVKKLPILVDDERVERISSPHQMNPLKGNSER